MAFNLQPRFSLCLPVTEFNYGPFEKCIFEAITACGQLKMFHAAFKAIWTASFFVYRKDVRSPSFPGKSNLTFGFQLFYQTIYLGATEAGKTPNFSIR